MAVPAIAQRFALRIKENGMLDFLKLYQIVTAIVQTVQTVETVMPYSPGVDKLKAATVSVCDKISAAKEVIPHVQNVISATVGLFNASKVFKKK